MNTLTQHLNRWLVLGAAALLLATSARAAELNAQELDAAIQSGDFTAFNTAITASLAKKVPADAKQISEAAMQPLLTDPTFVGGLSQRQFVAKVEAAELGAFAKAAPDNRKFLTWLLHNTEAMDGCLLAATPTGLKAREENNWRVPADALAIWKKIYDADPDSRQGIDLKLATATAIAPPGRVNIGAGGATTPADALVRYTYFKTAHQKKELAASFDKLGVWDLTKVVSSGASDEDLTWGREMVNTFRSDLRATEMMVDLTRSVWRRASPVPYTNMKTVLQGGGKCGPRSSFAVFINHAFGIPAIGVAQPAHACVAWRGVDGVWRVGYGKGWAASRLDGLSGPDFVEGSLARSRAAQFSQVEHLRWLSAALPTHEQTAAVLALGQKIVAERHGGLVDLNASLKPEEADAEPGVEAAKAGAPVGKKRQQHAHADRSAQAGQWSLSCERGYLREARGADVVGRPEHHRAGLCNGRKADPFSHGAPLFLDGIHARCTRRREIRNHDEGSGHQRRAISRSRLGCFQRRPHREDSDEPRIVGQDRAGGNQAGRRRAEYPHQRAQPARRDAPLL